MSGTTLRPPRPIGFTLIELIVALTITGLLATIVFRFLQAQTRILDSYVARQEGQQTATGALNMLASEFRSIPPGGIRRADTSSFHFRSPIAFGVYCPAPSDSAWPQVAFDSATMPGQPPGWTNVGYDVDGVPKKPSIMGVWFSSSATWPNPTNNLCTRQGAANNRSVRVMQFGGVDVPKKDTAFPGEGRTRMYLYDFHQLEHQAYQGRMWLVRSFDLESNSNPDRHRMAGPTRFVRFRYFRADGTEIPSSYIRSDTARYLGEDSIRGIRVIIATETIRRSSTHAGLLRVDSVTVFRRNVRPPKQVP